ncbi:hypothetical protein Poli38472_002376 [Pythium oligandrum]|uniref:Glutathione S-transferase n=1 Tax=Pythium oligandrum TaxID=41045 RepID=A0A8K1FH28_PYTOL|nr:hypothetical protein Poli38472_002376 [Pythium oligandrum]|eukprot:TMW63435.1 hypothetical protein Poli38472_002376 [Pythium oligandrum]
MSSPIKLTYLDVTGRAEITRLVFAASGIAFEDKRIGYPDLPALKHTLPLGQVPIIEMGGKTYPQSMAIARYAARIAGLYPTDDLEALNVEVVLETLVEVAAGFGEIIWGTPEDAKAAKIKVWTDDKLPKVFSLIESSIKGKFLLGDKLSVADLRLFDLFANSILLAIPDYKLDAYPKVAAVIENVKAVPNVAAYLAKRQ